MAIKKYTLKTYTPNIYQWSVKNTNVKKNMVNKKPYFCTAKPNSQGEDWVTTYVYDLITVNFLQQHSAYVECDYVV